MRKDLHTPLGNMYTMMNDVHIHNTRTNLAYKIKPKSRHTLQASHSIRMNELYFQFQQQLSVYITHIYKHYMKKQNLRNWGTSVALSCLPTSPSELHIFTFRGLTVRQSFRSGCCNVLGLHEKRLQRQKRHFKIRIVTGNQAFINYNDIRKGVRE